MLRLKSKSEMMTNIEHDQLREHVQMLVEKSEETIKEKIMKQQEKQARIEALENQFVEWAVKKENKIHQKLMKSNKNKDEYLGKIVKKCKQHDRYLGQKLKNYQKKTRASLKAAWKKAEQLNNQQEQRTLLKHSQDNSISKLQNTDQMGQSHQIHTRFLTQDYHDRQREYLSVSFANPPKNKNNAQKDNFGQINKSKRQLKQIRPIQINEGQSNELAQNNKLAIQIKLKETFARFKQNIDKQQQLKIQQLGERLEKIEKTRNKKLEIYKKKKEKYQFDRQTEQISKKQKKKTTHAARMHSQSVIYQKRTVDRSSATRQKRQQLLQQHIQNGSEYLQHQKIKFLKTHLAKQIANSAIQKKLYFERLNH